MRTGKNTLTAQLLLMASIRHCSTKAVKQSWEIVKFDKTMTNIFTLLQLSGDFMG